MHKYSKETTKYKDVPNDAQVLTTLDKYDSNETENLGMWLSHLSMPQMCASWVSEDDFNSLLEKYKIDITPYVKDDTRVTTSIKYEVRMELFYLINKD